MKTIFNYKLIFIFPLLVLSLAGCSKNAALNDMPGVPKNIRPPTDTAPVENLYAEFEWSSPLVAFPSTTVNTNREQVIVLKNKGTKKSSPIQLSWGDTASPFSVKAGTDTCQGVELGVNQTCTLTLKFTPTLNGNRTNVLMATDLITSKALIMTGIATGGTSGGGTTPTDLVWVLPDYDFGSTATGTHKDFDFILANVGGEISQIIDITWQSPTPSLTLVPGQNFCQNNTLAPGANCKVRVRFSPTASGAQLSTLRATDGISTKDIQVGGTGVVIPSQLAFNPTSYSFNTVLVGGQKSVLVKLRNNASVNSGVVSLSLMSASHYSIVAGLDQCSGQILPGGSECSVTVRFTPSAVQADITNTLSADDGSSSATVAFIGTGQDPASNNPVAINQSLNVAEDIFSLGSLQGMDPNGLPISYVIVGNPTKGNLALLNPNTGEFRYTPDLNATGADSFTFRVRNGNNDMSAVATVSVNIVSINDAPLAQNDTVSVNEDSFVNISVLSNDSDVEGNILSVVAVTQPSKGSVIINGDNTIRYTPQANFSGTDSFTYSINDGAGGSASAMVTITVNAVNDAPVASNSAYTIQEDATLSGQMQASDVDNVILTYTIVSTPTKGTLTLTNASTGSFIYVPENNYHGNQTFTFKVNDGTTDSNVATVTINVDSVNDTPVADNVVVNVVEDTAKSFNLTVSENDTTDILSYQIITQPVHGTISGTAPNLIYTPNSNYTGMDSLTYKVNDGTADSNVATVNFVVWAVNDTPVAFDDELNLLEDAGAQNRTLSASDVDNDALTYTILTMPTKGTLVLLNTSTGAYTYTPNANANGVDSFTFKVFDGTVESNIATVDINIAAVADLPVANNMNLQTLQDEAKSAMFSHSFIDNDALTFAIVTPPNNGLVNIVDATTGAFTYTPNSGYTGSDSFTFNITTAAGSSNTATVSVQVTSTNTAPVANNSSVSTDEDTMHAASLSASDAELNPLTYSIVSQGTKGVVTITNAATGAYTYTPNSNTNGSDSFTFQVSDGALNSNIATVSVTINPVNDIPVAHSKVVATAEDTPVAITLSGADVEGSSLSYIIVSNPVNGILSGTAPNLTFTPNANYTGNDNFTYKVNDGTADSTVVAVAIAISSSNDLPVASNSSFTTNEDSVYNGGLVASDADADNLTYSIVTQPTKGVVSLNTVTGSYTYTPNNNTNGADSFTFRVNDGFGNSNTATVAITITPVNDIPVANNLSINVLEDSPYSGVVSATDVEGSALTYSIVTNPSNGLVSLNASTGAFTYTPNQNYTGTDSFTFRANDGTANSNTATVSITVTQHNNLPVANNSSFTTNEDTVYNGSMTATDADNDALTYSIVANGAKGSVVITNAATGAFTYTPNSNTNGSDAFTFRVNDGVGNSNTATVSITINPVNDAPVAFADTVSTNRNTAKNIVLVGTDVENSTLTYTIVASPTKGVLSGTIPNLIYTPNNNQTGSDSFTFKVNDGQLDSPAATISITIANTNVLPVASNGTLSVTEDVAKTGNVTATDADGDTLTYSVVDQGTKGVVTITNASTGAYTYTPNANANGSDSFTFRANDGFGNSNTATVTVTIAAVNDAPIANAQSINTKQNTAVAITLTGTDVDGNPLTYVVVTNPTKGVLSGTAPNLTYTPNNNTSGSDSFTFRVNDGTVNSTNATVSITVQDLGNWFNTAWTNRRRIHINNQNFGALTDFPVMVKLDSSRIDYSKTKAAGADLRFTDTSGNLLSYEIERWNSAGISTVWVKIPAISANSTTDSIFMYYGNSAANDAQNKNAVWSNGYVAVYHLEETSGQPQDSSSNNNHGVSSAGTISRNVSGKVAGGEQFGSNSAVFRVNDSNSLDITNQLTMEAWMYQTSTGGDRSIVEKEDGSNPAYALWVNNGKLKMKIRSKTLEFTNALPNNSWTYVVGTFDTSSNTCTLVASQGELYKTTNTCTDNVSATPDILRLGNHDDENKSFLGSLDEIRISNVVRSFDWISAQHQSMADSYLVYGSEQSHTNALLKSVLSAIASNGDDGEVNQSGEYYATGTESPGRLPMGQDQGGNNWGYYRFRIPSSIPSGATITNTRLRIYGLGQGPNWSSSNMYLGIRGEKTANATQVAANNSYPGVGRVSTTATSSWGSPGLTWNNQDWNQSPNISSITQELVTTYSGLPANNYMQLWVGRGYTFSDTAALDQEVWAEDQSNDGYNQATVLIEWTQ